jgi:molybdopterin-synthase adenylyltransferase
MHPRLKDVFWRRHGAELRLVHGAREHLRLDDRNGTVELVLDLLRAGSRTPAELAITVGTPLITVEHLLDVLDRHRLLVDDDRANRFRDFDEVLSSAGSFFAPHATLGLAAHDMLGRLRAAHVLMVGVGGINAEVATQLAGLGVGQLTVAAARPRDPSDAAWSVPRQRLSDHANDAGPFVARVAAIDPTVQVVAADVSVGGAPTLGALLDRQSPDIVVADLGRAVSADAWVNASCVERGVSLVSAAIGENGAVVYSVDADRSACVACVTAGPAAAQDSRAVRVLYERPSPALCVPPVSGLVGSLVVFEVLRYITGYEPPAYANQPMHVELAAGGAMRRLTWRRDPSCPVCGQASTRMLSTVGAPEPVQS